MTDSSGVEDENTSWFGLRGRISRKQYWLHYVVPLAVGATVLDVVDTMTNARGRLSYAVTLLTIVPNLAAGVKRLHDRNKSGWFGLLILLPVIGWLWLFVQQGLLRGTAGPNRFGRDPLKQSPDRLRPMLPPAP